MTDTTVDTDNVYTNLDDVALDALLVSYNIMITAMHLHIGNLQQTSRDATTQGEFFEANGIIDKITEAFEIIRAWNVECTTVYNVRIDRLEESAREAEQILNREG